MSKVHYRTKPLGLLLALAVAGTHAGHNAGAVEVAGARHVVIIGVDGMSPDGVRQAKTPNIHRMMRDGAYTFHARGVLPTVSSPNWASMIMGAGPERHGVTSNDWKPDKSKIAPIVVGPGGIFPTIFSIMRQQRPSAVVGVFTDWADFVRLFEKEAANEVYEGKDATDTNRHAVAYIKEKKPTFTFIHYDHVDDAGHKYGFGTPRYYEAVGEADRLLGEIIDAVKDAGIYDQTVILVTADHGGKGKHHGGATMQEIEIPWIIAGPGIVSGKELHFCVNTTDTAATVAFIFGLTPPVCWIGKPVLEAFGSR